MLSATRRSTPLPLTTFLEQARRQAIGRGMLWFWLLNWLIVGFIWVRFEVYRQAGLTKGGSMPWSFHAESTFVILILLLLPLFAWLCRDLTDRMWLRAAALIAICWGGLWTLHIYTLGQVELRGGMSYASGIMRILMLAALIAFYADIRVLYGYLLGPMALGIGLILLMDVEFPRLYMLSLLCGILALEAGRRMLHRWFELAIVREHENLLLLERLEQLAGQDPLTGIANRRHFNLALEQGVAQSRDSGAPFSLILIDVDYFKRFNDHYGHHAGDACLKKVAKVLGDSVRSPSDLVARYGGEEFVLLLPDTDLPAAREVAARLQATLAEVGLEHQASDVAKRVTVSQGIACYIPDEGRVRLLERADKALYRAKAQGRNRFCVAD